MVQTRRAIKHQTPASLAKALGLDPVEGQTMLFYKLAEALWNKDVIAVTLRLTASHRYSWAFYYDVHAGLGQITGYGDSFDVEKAIKSAMVMHEVESIRRVP